MNLTQTKTANDREDREKTAAIIDIVHKNYAGRETKICLDGYTRHEVEEAAKILRREHVFLSFNAEEDTAQGVCHMVICLSPLAEDGAHSDD